MQIGDENVHLVRGPTGRGLWQGQLRVASLVLKTTLVQEVHLADTALAGVHDYLVWYAQISPGLSTVRFYWRKECRLREGVAPYRRVRERDGR